MQWQAVSDGSYKKQHGTAGWRISFCDSDDYFLGCVVVPGHTSCQSAYHSEYGIVVTVWAISSFYKNSFHIDIGCNGLAALNSIWNAPMDISPNVQHYDILSAIRFLMNQTTGTFQWRHIQGHQDDIQGQILDQWAQENVQMDTVAKDCWM
jgi:hypothetical protein